LKVSDIYLHECKSTLWHDMKSVQGCFWTKKKKKKKSMIGQCRTTRKM